LLQGIDPKAHMVEVLSRLDGPAVALTPMRIREQWQDASQAG